MDTHTTKVIYRVFKKGGDTIALFPEIPANYNPTAYCDSYMHIGQHGAASVGLGSEDTRPATEAEIEPLRKELESLGYNLQQVKCFHPSYTNTRIKTLKEQRA